MTRDKKELNKILKLHKKWLSSNEEEGQRANLRNADLINANLRNADLRNADLINANLINADLRNADLRNADLRNADLCAANLSDADLCGANLWGANLWSAYLKDANLEDANLWGAYLRNADLINANLRNANLCDADLRNANLMGAENISTVTQARLSVVPQSGSFVGWKKCKDNIIVKLLIPDDAKRSNATGRKCRASCVKVLDVIGSDVGISQHDSITKYRQGEIVTCHEWGENRWQECSGGIHFFITREEAEEY